MSRIVPVPVGDRPAWELEDQSMNVERAPWRSVADRWLSSAFPKLPKQRGSKQAGSNIPIHEYKAHDKFELSVGPHIFPDTSLFEVIYTHTDGRNAIAQTMGYVTPETERLVIAAAADNPDLAQLLEQARRHKPSEADTKKLAEIIHVHVPSAFANPSSTQAPPRPRAWDLIIEFKEKSLDRRIFPRGSVQLERAHETPWGKLFDAMVITTLPYSQQQIGVDLQLSGQQETLATPNDVSSPQPVTFHWRGLTQHGELFDIVRAAVAPPHAMKPIRPANADSGRTKRRNTRRKSTVEKPANAPIIPVSPAIQPPPSMGGQFSTFSVAQMAPQQVSANTPPALTAGAHPIDHISHTESSAPVPPASAGAYSPAPTFSAPATVPPQAPP
ncbi:hypothetical protein PHLGIDRAFT_34070 [Phlebiopsis gigantea 11061_1 CR5-6]|uniref:Uncharacterized protein n=1 Tax=Phlebiopsis gigantea (strain 11061_1 CR5-6) TaxID=745531 RepID=A0A0C3S3J7_PHLG1|nr:hypothetical protein PHLGIDRAFT_34070 [Phlebiopsis gigantea 11061_1 CR5-6]